MAGTPSENARFGRAVLIIFNAVFWGLSGVVLLAGGLLKVEGWVYGFIYTANDLTSVANLLIASGTIAVCIAGVGFIGACCKSRPLLIIFAVALCFTILLEVAVGIVGVVYFSQEYATLNEQYTAAWQMAISEYKINPDDQMQDVNNDAVDRSQQEFECCGGTAPDDWGVFNPVALNDLNQTLPSSCNCTQGDGLENCGTVTFMYNITSNESTTFYNISQTAWTVGCVNDTIYITRVLFVFLIGSSFSIATIEMYAIIISLCLFCCISSLTNQGFSRMPASKTSEETSEETNEEASVLKTPSSLGSKYVALNSVQ